ncbi:MAG: hypothetical protein AAFX05_07100, partial [Planctomycetota bacterium]
VVHASDPFAVKPIDLPSMRGGGDDVVMEPQEAPQEVPQYEPQPRPQPVGAAAAQAGPPPAAPSPQPAGGRTRPRLALTDWVTGRYRVVGQAAAAAAVGAAEAGAAVSARRTPRPGRAAHKVPPAGGTRPRASEQRASAQARAKAARKRAQQRIRSHRGKFDSGINGGVVFAVVVLLAGVVAGFTLLNGRTVQTVQSSAVVTHYGTPLDLHVTDPTSDWVFELFPGEDAPGQFLVRIKDADEVVHTEEVAASDFGPRLFGADAGPLLVVGPPDRLAFASQLLEGEGVELVSRETEQGRELEAEARILLGTVRDADPETVASMRAWLSASEATPGSMLWFSPDERWHLITTRPMPTTIPSLATDRVR